MSSELADANTDGLSSIDLSMFNDCEPDEQLDYITQDAATLFNVPIAMVNLVTPTQVMFKACVGATQGSHLDHKSSFCPYAIKQEQPYVVPDAMADELFKNNPLVTGPLKIRSYAGKSLHGVDGTRIGTLCLLDTKTRNYTEAELDSLCSMAELAESQLQSIALAQIG